MHRLGLDSGETCRGGVRGVGGFGAGGAAAGEEGGEEGHDPHGEGGNDGDVEAALAEQEELDVDDEDRSEYGDVREERLEEMEQKGNVKLVIQSMLYVKFLLFVCVCACMFMSLRKTLIVCHVLKFSSNVTCNCNWVNIHDNNHEC